ncbi:Ig-like domain-containing protein, partial [Conchiformibius steedae]
DGSEPIVWIESYGEQVLMPVASSGEMATPVAQTAAISSSAAVTAQTVSGSPLMWGAGALVAVGGIAAAASGGKGGGGSNEPNHTPQNSPNPPSGTGNKSDAGNPLPVAQPEITLNAITADNTLNRAEATDSVTVSGTVKNAANGDTVVLKIGNHNVETTIQNGSFSQAVDGKVLANANSITATVNGKDGSHSAVKTYSVDTEIATPIIKLKPITADNIINIAESKQTAVTVSGSVQHAKDGDTVVLRVGNAEYRATVAKGEFSTVVDGNTLANHQSISATVDTADTAGNTAQGTAQHAYRVVTTPPTGTISLDAITGDNIINRTESQGKIRISGRTEKVADGSEVIIS